MRRRRGGEVTSASFGDAVGNLRGTCVCESSSVALRLSDPRFGCSTWQYVGWRSGVDVSAPKESTVISITYSAASPELAHDVVDAITKRVPRRTCATWPIRGFAGVLFRAGGQAARRTDGGTGRVAGSQECIPIDDVDARPAVDLERRRTTHCGKSSTNWSFKRANLTGALHGRVSAAEGNSAADRPKWPRRLTELPGRTSLAKTENSDDVGRRG